MVTRGKILFAILTALLISVYAGGASTVSQDAAAKKDAVGAVHLPEMNDFFRNLTAAQELQSAENKKIKLDVAPLRVTPASQNGIQYFETDEFFIKSADPLHVGYNEAKNFFIYNLPRNCSPAGIEFKKPDALGLPGLKLTNTASADIFRADTYESEAYIITSYFPIEYNFADKKFVSAADSAVNAVVNTTANNILCENFTQNSRKIVLTYKNGAFSALANKIDGASPARLLEEILARENDFKDKIRAVAQGSKIIVAYKIFDKVLKTTTITMYVLK